VEPVPMPQFGPPLWEKKERKRKARATAAVRDGL
jgi:hypothetical protein